MKTYVTFGQNHTHSVNGKTLDKNTVAVITASSPDEGRELAFKFFGPKFSFEYPEAFWCNDSMEHFPGGYVEIN